MKGRVKEKQSSKRDGPWFVNRGQKGEEKPGLTKGWWFGNHGQKGEEKPGPTKGWWLVNIRVTFLFRGPGHFHIHHSHAVQTKIYH